MTFDPTKPVRTRDGREARIICTDAKGRYPFVALVSSDLKEDAIAVSNSGSYWDDGSEDSYDLINIPERVSWFANVYRDGDVGVSYKTKDETLKFGKGRKAVLEIIYEGDAPVETIIHTDV